MYKFFLSLLLIGPQLLSSQNITDKLVAYYSFNNCSIDDSQGASTGTFLGGVGCACGSAGITGAGLDSAAILYGIDGELQMFGAIQEALTTGEFSVSFYFKPASGSQGTQVVLAKQEHCDRNHSFWVRYNPVKGTISSEIAENEMLFANVSAKLDKGRCWQHIVLTRSFKTYKLYVNGILRDVSVSDERIDLTNTALVSVGNKICDLDKHYNGEFDELRVYKKALSEDEIGLLNLHPDEIVNRDTLIYLGNSFQAFTTQSCATAFAWTPADGVADDSVPSTIITPTLTTLYSVSFKQGGCVAYDSILVTVIDPDTLDCSRVFLPNAFTPGGSPGRNDKFIISNPFAITDFIAFEIFDRWGGRVFDAVSQFDGWDGRFQNQDVNAGVFLYRLRYRCEGKEKVKNGTLTLMR